MLKKLTLIGIIAATAGFVAISNNVFSAQETSRYSDKKTVLRQDIPKRPQPLELLQGFQREGPLDYEYQLPTGMVISPNLVFHGIYRNGIQAIDNGIARTRVEWVNNLDLFATLTLSGTERIHVGMSPLKEDGRNTKYTFEPDADDGWHNELNSEVTTLFFEGDLTEILPKLDWEGRRPLDYGIAVGRQPVLAQDGFLIADNAMDSVAITRNTWPFRGTAFGRYTFLYGWHGVHRSNNTEDNRAQLFGLLTSMDVSHSTVDLDMTYLDSTNKRGDQFNIALSAVQPVILFDTFFNTTFRLMGSLAPDEETAQVSEGALLFASISWAPKRTHNIAYLNVFGAIDRYAPASRKKGGPLGRTGLLFAGHPLASGAPIRNRAHDSFGGSLGYQMFFSPGNRRNLILEVGGKVDDSPGGFNTGGIAAKISQALGHRAFFTIDVFGIHQESRDNAFGLRTELTFRF